MALTLAKYLDLSTRCRPVIVQQLRYRNRPNLKNPLPMHYPRKRLYAVCEPILPTVKVCPNTLVTPLKSVSIIDENPYALFLAGKLRRNLAKTPMIAIFHTDSYTGRELLGIRNMIHDLNFPMEIQDSVNRSVVAAALKGTRWAPIIPLTQSKTAIGYCDTKDVPKLMKVLKKMPAFHLLALIFENQILHKAEVERLAKLSMMSVHSSLSSALSLPGSKLSENLVIGQMELSRSLAEYAKGSSPENVKGESESAK